MDSGREEVGEREVCFVGEEGGEKWRLRSVRVDRLEEDWL